MITIGIDDEGTLPITIDDLWKTLAAHFDDDAISIIHPSIRRQKTLEKEAVNSVKGLAIPAVAWVERETTTLRRTSKSTWKISTSPLEYYQWEVLASSGPLQAGSRVEITYTPHAAETQAHAKGQLILKGIPRFLSSYLARRTLNQIDREDIAYTRKTQSNPS